MLSQGYEEHFRPKIVRNVQVVNVQAVVVYARAFNSINLHNCTIDTPIMPGRMTLLTVRVFECRWQYVQGICLVSNAE